MRAYAADSIAEVPLTIRLAAGPATISTMAIYPQRSRHWWQPAVRVGQGVVVGVGTCLVAFGVAVRIARLCWGRPASTSWHGQRD